MSFRPMFLIGASVWCGNGQRFATREEAEGAAKARFAVWTMPRDWRVDASEEPVNYARRDGRDEPVETP